MYITDVTVKIEEFKRLCHVVVIMFANFKMFPTNFLSSTRIHKLFAILGILMIYIQNSQRSDFSIELTDNGQVRL